MKRERTHQPPRKMQNIYLIFYEGDTEKEYIDFLKRKYRSSVKIKTHKSGTKISSEYATKITDSLKLDQADTITTFFMFDQDVESVNQKIANLNGIKLLSNPCFEIWFLFHMTKEIKSISSDNCKHKLKQSGPQWINYSKGTLTDSQKTILWDNRLMACKNAKSFTENSNPSSTVYKLIEILENKNK